MSDAPVTAPNSPQSAPLVENPSETPDTGVRESMPRRFGKYTLIRKLAMGGMAELFLALQRSVAGFEKLIVVKRVLPHLAKDESFIEMLLTEARIAATLNHPNVAHIYDVGEVDGQYYIAMEHIHGEDLRAIVRQMKKKAHTGFALENAIAIVLGCCTGLAYAHQKKNLDGEPMRIVHRDVSPQNILVTFTGDIKLVDFGIAKAGRSSMENTDSGQLKGKIPYMSPEQAQGHSLDERSDIFSLGIILFELCTGRRLFRGKTEMETLRRIVEDEYPRPTSLNPNLHDDLERIILRALAKNPNERYQTAVEMQAELEDFIRSNQLKVSSLGVGAWMRTLFEEKLEAQNQMLQEGRQLAEVLAAEAADEHESSIRTAGSGIHAKSSSRIPWILVALLTMATMAGGFFVMNRSEPEPELVTGPGVLTIHSDPAGAAITIDGQRRSERTPTALRNLPVGHYSVRLSLDGYDPYTESVDISVEAPEINVDATLEVPSATSFGILRVQTTPPGANILLDGRDTGLTTPATVPEITPDQRHRIMLTLEGYQPNNQELLIGAGALEEVNVTLERAPLGPNEALLHVVVDPPEARVRLGDETQRGVSPYEFRVEARRYTIIVTHPGYRRAERELSLEGGQERTLEFDLERNRRSNGSTSRTRGPAASGDPGRLTIGAQPGWCNVTVDGRAAGQTPVVNFEVSPGRHTIVCTHPSEGTRRVNVNVPAGQTVRRNIRF